MFCADQGSDTSWGSCCVVDCQLFDHCRVHPGYGSGALWRPLRNGLAEFVEAECVRVDPLVVGQPVANDDVHHCQHHGDVGAWQRLDELVAAIGVDGLGSHGPDRVDDDQSRTLFSSLLDGRPKVAIGQPRVGRPENNQFAVGQLCWVHSATGAVGHRQADTDGGSTESSMQLAGTHMGKEAAAEPCHREQALVAGVGERQHGFRAMGVDYVVETSGDRGQGLFPRDLLELSRSLRADAAQWVEHTIWAVYEIEKPVDLRAELTERIRMVGIAA